MALLFYSKNDNRDSTDRFDIAHEQGCDVCPLKENWKKLKSPVMRPTGYCENPDIMIIGEAPGETEDLKDRQFVGKSGQLLRDVLRDNISIDKIAFDNILACRPPSNRNPTEFEMECCRSRLIQNILTINPRIIVTYGAIPLKFFTGKDQIFAWRGRTIPISFGMNSFWISFNLHPSFILRQGGQGNRNSVDRKFMHAFEMDHRKINDFLHNNDTFPKVIKGGYRDNVTIYDGSDEAQLKKLERHLSKFAVRGKRYAIDIETTKLSPFYDDYILLSCAIGTYKDVASFVVDHPRGWQSDRAKRKVKRMLYKFLMNSSIKEAHHAKFEMIHLSHMFGKEVVLDTKWDDTAAQAVSLDERPGKKNQGMTSLDMLTLIHFGFELKSQSDVDRKNLLAAPVTELLYYNGMDSKYEHLLSIRQRRLMDAHDARSTKQRVKIAKALCFTEQKGLCVDRRLAAKFGREYERTAQSMLDEIADLKEIRAYEKKFGKKFSPGSNTQLTSILRDILHLAPLKTTSKGGYSTDKEVMAELSSKNIKLADYIVKYREATKNKSTYVDSVIERIYPDNLLHPEFSHLFVVSGRLSGSNPNVQNFPSRNNKRARNVIVPPPDHYIVPVDYGQIEARVIASVARDYFFVKSIFEEYDIHMDWAKRVAIKKGILKELTDDELKKLRKNVKNTLVFPWLYGAQVPSVAAAIDLDEHRTGQLFNDFWDMFPGSKAWQEELLELYRRTGMVISSFGRKRRYPMSPNEIFNTPVQGTASDVVLDAMYRLTRYAYKHNKPHFQPVMNIHDDLTFYLPKETFEDDIVKIAEIMVTQKYDWLIVPLSVEVSRGEAWGEVEAFKTYETRDFMELRNVLTS